MSIEDDLRGEFTDQEWSVIRQREDEGDMTDDIARRHGMAEAEVNEILCRWRGLVANWEMTNWPSP